MAVNEIKFVKQIQSKFDPYLTTILLALLLIGWYEVEWVVLILWGSGELNQWLFAVESISKPTPGWIFAGISHDPARPLRHLGFNVVVLLLFGGFAERHLRNYEYLIFFVGVGIASNLLQVMILPSSGAVNGASGAILGLMMYSTYHFVSSHDDQLSFEPQDGPLLQATLEGMGWVLKVSTVFVLPIAVPLYTMGQLSGFISSGGTAVVSHAAGLFLGVYGHYLQPVFGDGYCGVSGG